MKGKRMSCSEYWSIVGVGPRKKEGSSRRGGKKAEPIVCISPPSNTHTHPKAKAWSFDESEVVNSKYW